MTGSFRKRGWIHAPLAIALAAGTATAQRPVPQSTQPPPTQSQSPQAPSPTFKIDVRLVRLLVTVKNQAGDLVGSLDQKSFAVYDNGVPQQVEAFERQTALPLSVAVLLDTSGSTGKELHYETASVAKFLKALFGEGNPRDTAALYGFNYEVTLLQDFTRNQMRFEDRMRGILPDGGTSLYDATYFASEGLRRRDGRHVIVAVSDGGDTASGKKFADALRAAHMADSVIYPIVVMPITNEAGRNLGGERALEALASGTGGRTFYPSSGAQLDAAFADILRDLRTQYLLSYYPRNQPKDAPHFHAVRVEVNRKDLRVVTRTGYYDEETP